MKFKLTGLSVMSSGAVFLDQHRRCLFAAGCLNAGRRCRKHDDCEKYTR